MYRIIFAVWLLLAGTAQAPPPDLSGNWKLDYKQSTADLSHEASNRLIIAQTSDDVRFDYYQGQKVIASETIRTDGKSRQRYKTKLETAYIKARWQKGALVMITDSVLDNAGTQTYSSTDRWETSKDGNTLYKKSSDGKVTVFSREAPPAAPAAPQ